MEFRIPYFLMNDGAGSATLHIAQSLTDARNAENDFNENPEPFAESTAELLTLRLIDGKLYFQDVKWNDKLNNFTREWVEIYQDR